MPNEASKTRALWGPDVLGLLEGDGIDIGCGDDPILPSVERFDRQQGDANRISRFVARTYDFAVASHVLEHMEDPGEALREWLSIVRPGGYLVVLVPDEDLYEQGTFPSLFNDDHKFTFTISKARSWSPRSVNVLDLVRGLPCELVSIHLQDIGYDRRLLRHAPGRWGRRAFEVRRRMSRWLPTRPLARLLEPLFLAVGAPVDQTTFPDARLAQIQIVLRRAKGGG